jgi:hypothetical protein
VTRNNLLIAKDLLGQKNVFMLHPLNKTTPASIDFSGITSKLSGTLNLALHSRPTGDCRAVIFRNGRIIEDINVGGNKWIFKNVSFSKGDKLSIENQTLGRYSGEALILTYQIE